MKMKKNEGNVLIAHDRSDDESEEVLRSGKALKIGGDCGSYPRIFFSTSPNCEWKNFKKF
jgi:hypothetical protein